MQRIHALINAKNATNKDNVRKTTQEEQSPQRKLMTITFLGLLILVSVSIMLFMKKRA